MGLAGGLAANGGGIPGSVVSVGSLSSPVYVLPLPLGGGRDDGPNLSSFVSSTPAGSSILAPSGVVYNIGTTFQLEPSRAYDFGLPSYLATGVEPPSSAAGGAVFRQAANTALDYVVASKAVLGTGVSPVADNPIRVAGILVDGNGANQTSGAGIGLGIAAWQSRIENFGILNCRGHGIVFPQANQGGNAFSPANGNMYENSFGGQGKVSNCGGHGILDAAGWTDGTIEGHIVVDTVGLSGINLANASGWRIAGCHLWNIGTDGILSTTGYATRVHDNYIEGFGARVASGAQTSKNPWTYSAYAAGTTYPRYAVVTSAGVLYYSKIDGNVGNTPASSPTQWAAVNAGATAVYGMAFFAMGTNRPVQCHDNTASIGHVSIVAIAGINYRGLLLQSNTSGISYAKVHDNAFENEYANGQAATAMPIRAAVQAGGALSVTGMAPATGTNSVVGTFSQASSIDAGVTAWAVQ